MNKSFEYKGVWFLPSEPDNRVIGILRHDIITGSYLELLGSFSHKQFDMSFGEESLILGVTNDSKEITLYKCFVTQRAGLSLKVGKEIGLGTTKYVINSILEGTHIFAVDQLKFQKIKARLYNLDQWVGITGFKIEMPDFANIGNSETVIRYKIPESIGFKVNDKIDGKFDFSVNIPGQSRYDEELAIKQTIFLILSSNESLSLEEWLRFLFSFQNFLLFGLYEKTYPEYIEFTGNDFYDDYGDGIPVNHKIIMYSSMSNVDTNEAKKKKLDLQMLFSYNDIKTDFVKIINNWFKKYELLRPAFNLVVEQFNNNERFSENTFLNLAQAAETFHLRTNSHTKIPKADYDKMKSDILENVEEKYHDWLKEQFNYGNNLNLAQRLDEILAATSNPVLDKIIGDKKKFSDQIRWTRNYYTHYTPSGEKKALKGTALFHLAEKLKIVLVCVFLKEVGFKIGQIEKLLERNKWQLFNHIAEW